MLKNLNRKVPTLTGDCSRLVGDCTGITGDLDSCDISPHDRTNGIDIDELVCNIDRRSEV